MGDFNLKIGEKDGMEFEIGAEDIVTERTAVIGMSGSGKSHLVGVICEELAEKGLPFIIIDPEGEYFSLKEKYETIWASNSKKADIPLRIEILDRLVEEALKRKARVIIDTSESSDEFEIVSYLLKKVYGMETEMRVPVTLIVEEADRFVPQSGGDSIEALYEISRRGRKRGIGLIVVTQRPAMVDKNVLSQCNNQFIGKLRSENDLKAVKLFFSTNKERNRLPELERGQFFVMGNISSTNKLIRVRERKTRDVGFTPSITEKNAFTVGNFVRSVSGNEESSAGALKEEIKSPSIPNAEANKMKNRERERAPETPQQDGIMGAEKPRYPVEQNEIKKEEKNLSPSGSNPPKEEKSVGAVRDSLTVEHFIYGPVPKKGYAVRAESPNAHAGEYKEILKGYFVPIDPIFMKDYSHEARMIVSSPEMEQVIFSRIFKRRKVDDKGRGGILNHTAIIPRKALENGLSYKRIDEIMSDFERENGIPIGGLQPLEISYERGEDEDTANVHNVISKSSLEKIIDSFQKNQRSKLFMISKNSTFEVRIELAYALSKIIDIKLKLAALKIITDPPLPLILEIFPNVVISGRMIHLKPNRGWFVVKPFKEEMGIYTSVEKEKVERTLEELYGK